MINVSENPKSLVILSKKVFATVFVVFAPYQNILNFYKFLVQKMFCPSLFIFLVAPHLNDIFSLNDNKNPLELNVIDRSFALHYFDLTTE